MLDLATEACKHHLEEKTQYPTSNMGSIPTSASDSESTTSGLSTPKREGFTVRFHVYAPLILSPEEVLEDFEIGIVSSLHDWSVSDMDPMESKRLPNNGWLITGEVFIPIETEHFEYKYVLVDKTTNTLNWECLVNDHHGSRNRVFNTKEPLKDCVVDKYDGVMLPSDNGRHLVDQHREETIKTMLLEVLNNKELLRDFELTRLQLDTVWTGLKESFDDFSPFLNNKICEVLMDILQEKNDLKLSLMLATAVLWNKKESDEKWSLNSENLNLILKSLAINEITVN